MRSRCAEYELTVSYDRRMVQARMEILEAERARRERGGSLDELVADLPRILGADGGRATAAATRVSSAQPPTIELHWPDGREELDRRLDAREPSDARRRRARRTRRSGCATSNASSPRSATSSTV